MSWRKNELFVLNWTINAKKSFYFANPSAFWLRKSADSSFHQASELGPWSGLKTWNLQKHEYVLGDLASKTLKNENWQLANPSYLNNVFFPSAAYSRILLASISHWDAVFSSKSSCLHHKKLSTALSPFLSFWGGMTFAVRGLKITCFLLKLLRLYIS